ncbi:MAG: hypothetical protein ABSE63_07750 [Thermoguttaceae bacterium]|jgi:hypothetical protein
MTTHSYRPLQGDTLLFVRDFPEVFSMIRSVGPLRSVWLYARSMNMPRSGPMHGALGKQLSALQRRRRLDLQQQDLKAGLADYRAAPPYPLRPRPPS